MLIQVLLFQLLHNSNLKQNYLFNNTSIQSGISNRQIIPTSSCTQIRSASLRKAISRIKQENRVSIIGISSISNTKIPKNQSYFQIKLEQKHNRISNPSQEPHMNINQFDQKKETIRRINQLQQFCKSQTALEIAAQKYSLKKSFKGASDLSTVPTLIDKLQDIVNKKSSVIQDVMREEIKKRIPKKQKEINYELDSMFKHYKSFSQLCLNENINISKEKVYNGYLKVYNSGKNDRIFLDKIEEKRKSLSDESEEYRAFLGEIDEATIQRDVQKIILLFQLYITIIFEIPFQMIKQLLQQVNQNFQQIKYIKIWYPIK